jgi:hypothetical protein
MADSPTSSFTMTLRPVTSLAAPLAAALVLALLSGSAVRAEECTWGEPGYRDCVDAKLQDLRKQEAGKAPRRHYKTVPAKKRPGTLTPDLSTREIPRLPDVNGADYGDAYNPARSQRQFNTNQGRIQQNLVPPVQLPPPGPPITIPGQVCPQGGCY